MFTTCLILFCCCDWVARHSWWITQFMLIHRTDSSNQPKIEFENACTWIRILNGDGITVLWYGLVFLVHTPLPNLQWTFKPIFFGLFNIYFFSACCSMFILMDGPAGNLSMEMKTTMHFKNSVFGQLMKCRGSWMPIKLNAAPKRQMVW